MKIFVFLMLNVFLVTTHAQSSDPWSDLLVKVLMQGEQTDTDLGQVRGLARWTPNDTSKDHLAEYITILGTTDEQGRYSILSVNGASEKWSLDVDGNWQIDQWFFYPKSNGELGKAVHKNISKKQTGEILSVKEEPLESFDLLEKRWVAFRDSWDQQ